MAQPRAVHLRRPRKKPIQNTSSLEELKIRFFVFFGSETIFLVALVFGTGTALGAPFTTIVARLNKPRHSAILALCATAASYGLLIAGVTPFLAHVIERHGDTETVLHATIVVVQFLLIVGFCILNRRICQTAASPDGDDGHGHTASIEKGPPDRAIHRFGTIAELRKLAGVLSIIVLTISGGFLFFREKQLGRIPESAWQALRQPREMTLYSLGGTGEEFYGYGVLGQTLVSTTKDRTSVHATIRDAIIWWHGESYLCFNPRHGVRVYDGVDTYDFLICFECHAMAVFRNGKSFSGGGINGSRERLDSILSDAGIKLEFPSTGPIDDTSTPQ